MEHDDASRIAVLLDDANRNAFAFRSLTQAVPQLQALGRPRRKPLVRRHGMKNVKFGLARARDAQRPIERMITCLREIDRAQDLLDRCQTDTSPSSRRGRFRCRSFFGTAGSTPSVHEGASLAGNESARTLSISRSSIPTFPGCSLPRFSVSRS